MPPGLTVLILGGYGAFGGRLVHDKGWLQVVPEQPSSSVEMDHQPAQNAGPAKTAVRLWLRRCRHTGVTVTSVSAGPWTSRLRSGLPKTGTSISNISPGCVFTPAAELSTAAPK